MKNVKGFFILHFNLPPGYFFTHAVSTFDPSPHKNYYAMKKIFTWLLIAAAGAVITYSCSTDTKDTSAKGLIIGDWEIDSIDISKTGDSSLGLMALVYISEDSTHNKLRFSFHANGLITEENEAGRDSSRYEWEGDKTLNLTGSDSTKEKWFIHRLDSAKLVVMAEDSVVFYFNRKKEN
jgi:hypothetical protein